MLLNHVPNITEMCAGKKVLHLGCTNAPYTEDSISNNMLLHFELEKVAASLCGIDGDQSGLDILEAHGTAKLYFADLEKLDALELNETFDVIVAGEMIEHLNNPGQFLSGIRRLMNPETRLLITTINSYCGMRFFQYGLRGKRGKAEPVHPDHVAYYSYATLSLLLSRHDLNVESFQFYDIGREHRPHNRWFLNLCNDICVRVAPQWADGIIAVCRIAEARAEARV